MGGDVLSTLDAIRWTVRHAGSALADRWIGPSWQRCLLMSGGRCRWVPFGVVGMLGTWNYPLFLNAPPIAQALAAGNAVVFKASEQAALCGARLQESLDEAGVPEGLVAVVQGGPEAGRAVVESAIDKAMFTGGVENGRQVLSALGRRGIPALAELSGFDPADRAGRRADGIDGAVPDLGRLRGLRPDLRGREARLRGRRPPAVGRCPRGVRAGAAGRRPCVAGDRHRTR